MMDYIIDPGMQVTISVNSIPLQYKKYRLPFEYLKTTQGSFGCILLQVMKGEGWQVQQVDFFIEQKIRVYLHTLQPMTALCCMLEGYASGVLHDCGNIVLNTHEAAFWHVCAGGGSWVDFSPGHYEMVLVEFTASFLQPFIIPGASFHRSSFGDEGPQVCALTPRALEQVEKIRNCELQAFSRQLFCQARIHDLLCFYFEALQEAGEDDMSCKERSVRGLATYIKDNLGEPITVSSLARLCGMSHFALLKVFKKVYHQTPVEYLRQQRLEKATEMLREGRYSITCVAQEVGFTDIAYFSRVFRQYFGCAPSVYREVKRYGNAG
jgi:AraC-like DNA-binding protein